MQIQNINIRALLSLVVLDVVRDFGVHFLINLKTQAVAPFSPDARTFPNIYKLQKIRFIKASIISDSFYG
jgi:hypothetical protein